MPVLDPKHEIHNHLSKNLYRSLQLQRKSSFDHIAPKPLSHARHPVSVPSMRTHIPTERLLDEAERSHRCAIGGTDAQRRALLRRRKAGILISPYRNLYARAEYWSSLTPPQQHIHTARALSIVYPHWIFAGLTAACAYGLDHSHSLHADMTITIASTSPDMPRQNPRLRRIRMKDTSHRQIAGLPVTDIHRTLIDCATLFPFASALPMFDSAARKGVSLTGLPDRCRALGIDSANVTALCTYADPLSENGGESFARATIIQLGFVVPRLQRPFVNPANPNAPLRADFTWELPGDIIIVAEFDGMGKYVMTDTKRSSIQAKVHAEREREDQLKSQGVTTIVRFEFEDLTHSERLERKLLQAGVPKRR
ncbi:hypothetical protein [Bifidobacterium callimiconis]|uniref:CTP synthase n=1 Tax=Bifidobacterium callimiconis TaxID=2306973 RepID=A0A430FDZ6_9BIFI|nr:hypothetical protein [Bifidobacterium callimiconis]RSX51124.1 hypothetical protein D2E23_0969 [Bifidobacterium callimiconis]